jgi:predicted aconitase with swiveling domain
MIEARAVLVRGEATGEVVALTEPLSFWGGVHESAGTVIDVHHPQHGRSIAGRVVVMPSGRGSSSSSSVLAEVIRAGVGPAAIILRTADPILVVGALVAEALYGTVVPILTVGEEDYARCTAAHTIRIAASGVIEVE